MATATNSRKRSAETTTTAPDAPNTTAPDAPNTTAPDAPNTTAPDAPSPTLQDALNAPLPGTERVEKVDSSGDANTVVFKGVCTRLANLIMAHVALMVAVFADRGAIVAEGLNVKLSRSRNADQRKKNRAAGLDAMELTALQAYDPDAESKPNLERWHRVFRVCERFPSARNLPSVNVALVFAETLTRIEPPKSFDAPEEWELKRHYDAPSVSALIDRAIAERMTADDVREALERLTGKVESDTPGTKTDDPVKAARTLAESIMSKITERKIDPETLFDELQAQLTRYGWALVKGHNGNGAETLKPVKTGR